MQLFVVGVCDQFLFVCLFVFHQKTGELVAVKQFNQSSFNRQLAVQDREFEIMSKLDHKNIVRFLAWEVEVSSGVNVPEPEPLLS